MHILGEMSKALTAARAELGEHAPRIEMFKIPTDKIREVIGTGGKVRLSMKAVDQTTGEDLEAKQRPEGGDRQQAAQGGAAE
jgi:polyribonucleotide nucleotidyltransferase